MDFAKSRKVLMGGNGNTIVYYFERGIGSHMFGADGSYNDSSDSYCILSSTKRQNHTWSIDDKLVIEIDKCGVKEYFQLLAIFENELVLKSWNK
jgi:hypothetical protein